MIDCCARFYLRRRFTVCGVFVLGEKFSKNFVKIAKCGVTYSEGKVHKIVFQNGAFSEIMYN